MFILHIISLFFYWFWLFHLEIIYISHLFTESFPCLECLIWIRLRIGKREKHPRIIIYRDFFILGGRFGWRCSPDDTVTQLYEEEDDQRQPAQQHPANRRSLSDRDYVSEWRERRRTSSRDILASPRHPRNRLVAAAVLLKIADKRDDPVRLFSRRPWHS